MEHKPLLAWTIGLFREFPVWTLLVLLGTGEPLDFEPFFSFFEPFLHTVWKSHCWKIHCFLHIDFESQSSRCSKCPPSARMHARTRFTKEAVTRSFPPWPGNHNFLIKFLLKTALGLARAIRCPLEGPVRLIQEFPLFDALTLYSTQLYVPWPSC